MIYIQTIRKNDIGEDHGKQIELGKSFMSICQWTTEEISVNITFKSLDGQPWTALNGRVLYTKFKVRGTERGGDRPGVDCKEYANENGELPLKEFFTSMLHIDNSKEGKYFFVLESTNAPCTRFNLYVVDDTALAVSLCSQFHQKPIVFGDEILNEKSQMNLPLQRIFYGAPGTGKSNTIKREVEDKGRVHFRTTFHPDSDYSTFVGCYKPTTTKSSNAKEQTVLDYESLVDKFKEYLEAKPTNITKACTLFGYSFHDSIVRMQEGTKTIPDLVADAYKSGSTYDSQVRAGMSVYETNPLSINETIQITYEFVPQAFAKAYCEAWNKYGESEDAEPVFLIVEEINRGNCAQIFGDLFQLLDRETEGERCGFSTYPIDADEDLKAFLESGTKKDGTPWLTNKDGIKDGKLCLPPNFYIWATMNTSDQSLFPIDSAFKRRWDWKYVPIDTKKENWTIKTASNEYSWSSFLEKINEEIDSTTHSEDKMLGFYFCRANSGVIDADKFVSKVLFYIYNDVFKDYGFDREMFKDGDGKVMSFKSYYKTDGSINESMVLKFLDNLKVEKNTIEDNANKDPNIKTE